MKGHEYNHVFFITARKTVFDYEILQSPRIGRWLIFLAVAKFAFAKVDFSTIIPPCFFAP